MMNSFQVAYALNSVFYNDLLSENELETTLALGLKHRLQELVRMEELPEINDSGEKISELSLITAGDAYRPNLSFDSSFLSIKPEFKKIPMDNLYRHTELLETPGQTLPDYLHGKRFGRAHQHATSRQRDR